MSDPLRRLARLSVESPLLLLYSICGQEALAQGITTTVIVGNGTAGIAANPITNKIYTADFSSNVVTVLDGATNLTTSVPVGMGPRTVAVNPVTNKIYVGYGLQTNITR